MKLMMPVGIAPQQFRAWQKEIFGYRYFERLEVLQTPFASHETQYAYGVILTLVYEVLAVMPRADAEKVLKMGPIVHYNETIGPVPFVHAVEPIGKAPRPLVVLASLASLTSEKDWDDEDAPRSLYLYALAREFAHIALGHFTGSAANSHRAEKEADKLAASWGFNRPEPQ